MMHRLIYDDGKHHDEILLTGKDIEDIRKEADLHISRRGWNKNCCYSEKVKD